MNRTTFALVTIGVLILHISLFAQQDNGNLFELTWKADLSQHKGDFSEMGTYAPEGLDIDQDGYREFLVYDHAQIIFEKKGRLQLWENVGNDDFQLVWEQEYPDYESKNNPGAGLTVTDLDKDDKQEILIAVENSIYIYEWDGTTFESGAGLPDEPTKTLNMILDNVGQAIIRSLIVKNLDPDPDLEIFMGYGYNQGLYCVIGSLPGSDLSASDWKLEFADDFLSVETDLGGGYRVGGVVIDDFDGDGKMEIFTSHWQDVSATRVYENDGIDTYVVKHTNLPETLVLYPPFDGAFANPIFHDFDGDGDSEFVISDIHGHIFLITKEASNNFEDFGPSAWTYLMNWPTVPDGGFIRSGYMGDLDQDGKPDIYYNDYRAQAVLDLEYQGGLITDTNSWIPYEIYQMPGRRFGKVGPAGDLDGDGLGELVCNMGGLRGGQNLMILESQHMASSVSQKKLEIPGGYSLHQNYPNPFNPTTTISYSLNRTTNVSLMIFDLTGKEVTTLVKARQAASRYSVNWDGRDSQGKLVPTGIYIYRIVTDDFAQSKKMVFVQ